MNSKIYMYYFLVLDLKELLEFSFEYWKRSKLVFISRYR